MANVSPAAALRRGLRQFEQGDVKGAFVLLACAARAGIPEAEFRVGRCYLEGALVHGSAAGGVSCPGSRISGPGWRLACRASPFG